MAVDGGWVWRIGGMIVKEGVRFSGPNRSRLIRNLWAENNARRCRRQRLGGIILERIRRRGGRWEVGDGKLQPNRSRADD